MFVDDLLLFCKADPTSLHCLMKALTSFSETAGLRTNLQKSQIVLRGCNTNLQQQCLHITGLQDNSCPLTYLGVSIMASHLTKIECVSLVKKIIARVHL